MTVQTLKTQWLSRDSRYMMQPVKRTGKEICMQADAAFLSLDD